MKTIHPEAIRAHMRFLSDSLLQGRAPGTTGYDIAARYVAAQLEATGLQPGGEDGGWFQLVPVRKAVPESAKSSLTLIASGKEQKLVDSEDYVFNGDTLRPTNDIEAPVVFVGFGVTAPEENYDDYAGIDVRGKIVAAIYGAPARFHSTVRAYYSDDVVKGKNALAHGALAILTLLLPEYLKRYPWATGINQFQMGYMSWLDKDATPHDPFPYQGTAAINQHAAELLFAGAPKTLQEVFASAEASKPQAFPLDVRARIHAVSSYTEFKSPNIVAKLQGSDPLLRSQYVVYSAHVDHLGICPPVEGDNVCHGTKDNASGVATLLEVARAYASLPKAPRRSVLFVFVTGEEFGGFGADYFAHYPPVPLNKVVADVNIDVAPGFLFPMKDVVAVGIEHSTIEKDIQLAAHQAGYSVTPDPLPEENGFIRSDQYSFVLQGIPAVILFDGVKGIDPKIDGLAVFLAWFTTKYHTPLDNMNQPLDYESGAKAALLNFLVGYEIAQQQEPPAWNQGDFFGTRFGHKHEASAASQK